MITAAKRCIRYLAGTKQFGPRYHKRWISQIVVDTSTPWSISTPIKAYTDADWAGQQDTRKSTGGLILQFNGSAVSWSSKTLRTIALSSQDAEYMALSDGSREVVYVRNVLTTLGFNLSSTDLFGDNNGSLAVAKNPAAHQKTKHIQVRYHYIRQLTEDKTIDLKRVDTQDQLADVMTKSLSAQQHQTLTRLIAAQFD